MICSVTVVKSGIITTFTNKLIISPSELMDFSTQVQSPKERAEIVAILTNAFSEDALTLVAFKKETLPLLFGIIFDYFAAYKKVCIGREDGEVKCVLLWDDNSSKPLTFADFLYIAKLALKSSPFWRYRIWRWMSAMDKNHYKGDHHYIRILASKQSGKGYGSALMTEFLKDNKNTIYLENSNESSNGSFYRKLGFKMVGEFSVYGVRTTQYIAKQQ